MHLHHTQRPLPALTFLRVTSTDLLCVLLSQVFSVEGDRKTQKFPEAQNFLREGEVSWGAQGSCVSICSTDGTQMMSSKEN